MDRRTILKTISAPAAAGSVISRPQPAAAQQVKWSAGTKDRLRDVEEAILGSAPPTS
jgi:hypothetical protein